MRIREVSISGYRSLRAIRFPVGGLTVFVGANGVGKTNLYRALELLQAAASGTLARELASEGGMEAALWADKRMANNPARMKLSVGLAAGDGPRGRARSELDGATWIEGLKLGGEFENDEDRVNKHNSFRLSPMVLNPP